MSTKFLLVCFVLFVMQRSISGLNCYSCSAGTDGCGVSLNSKGGGVVQVSQTASGASCTKSVAASNTNAISRDSSPTTCTTITVTATTGLDGYTTYCCSTDLCNGIPTMLASVILPLATVALSLFYTM